MTSYMCEDLGLETKLADCFAVCTRLFARNRAGELDVVDAEMCESRCLHNLDLACKRKRTGVPKLVQSFSNLDLGLRVEKGVGELFALS